VNPPLTIPLVSSAPLNAGQFAITVLCRLLQGLGAATAVLTPIRFADDSAIAAATAALCAATLLCGAGLTVVLERLLKPVLGVQSACVIAALFGSVGLSLFWMSYSQELWLLGSLLIGIAIGSDWSSISEVARRSLPTTLRWRGIRICTHASVVFGLTTFLAVAVFILLLFASPLRVEQAVVTPNAVPSVPPSTIPEATHQSETAEQPSSGDGEECDATECCGGGVREIVPTAFGQGVSIAAVGMLSFYLTTSHILICQYWHSGWALTAFAVGLPAGSLLMVSTAPRIGYAVALLPCMLFSIVSAVVFQTLSIDSDWVASVAFLCGVFSAAVTCGISSIVGELFSDCPTDAKRSRMLSVASFAASAVMVAFAALQLAARRETAIGILWAGVFAVGLLTVRRLPSPVISSLGKADDSSSDDEELNDVLSALNN
jgi:hypothetical protein